jgi:hypothetical protein
VIMMMMMEMNDFMHAQAILKHEVISFSVATCICIELLTNCSKLDHLLCFIFFFEAATKIVSPFLL